MLHLIYIDTYVAYHMDSTPMLHVLDSKRKAKVTVVQFQEHRAINRAFKEGCAVLRHQGIHAYPQANILPACNGKICVMCVHTYTNALICLKCTYGCLDECWCLDECKLTLHIIYIAHTFEWKQTSGRARHACMPACFNAWPLTRSIPRSFSDTWFSLTRLLRHKAAVAACEHAVYTPARILGQSEIVFRGACLYVWYVWAEV